MGFAGLQHGFQIQNISRKKSHLYLIDINLRPVCEQKHNFYFEPCCSDSSGWQKLNLNSLDTLPRLSLGL